MTDNEIIKALECCTTKGAKCSDCPAFKKVDRSDCKKYFRGAIDLINRQQTEIEKLNVDLVGMRGAFNYYKKHYDKAKAEIKRLQTKKDNLIKTFAECQKDVIKEFAERLKEEIDIRPTHSNEQNKYVCFLIDNLVKEMVGGE